MQQVTLWHHYPVIVVAGDWVIRRSDISGDYAVSCAGNFRGWFSGPGAIAAHFRFPRGQELAEKLRKWEAQQAQVRLSI